MSEIQNNTGTISGTIEGSGSVSDGTLTPKVQLKGGTIAMNQSGTKDYDRLENKPQKDGVTLEGNQGNEELHIAAIRTSAEWAELTTLVSVRGEMYVYSDATQDAEGNPMPMVKIGDGNAYVVDLPFATAIDMRITAEDIENWNNKVAVRLEEDNLIFY